MYIHIELFMKRVIGLTIFCIINLKEKFSKFSSTFLKKTKKTSISVGFFKKIDENLENLSFKVIIQNIVKPITLFMHNSMCIYIVH